MIADVDAIADYPWMLFASFLFVLVAVLGALAVLVWTTVVGVRSGRRERSVVPPRPGP